MTGEAGDELELSGFANPTVIGRGGYAVVYRACQTRFDRLVAVKVFDNLLLETGTVAVFERECKAIGRLSGRPNILTVYDAGISPAKRPYLVMAYMAGGSLEHRIADGGSLPWAEVTAIGVKLARALEAAHGAAVLHRDVKPENVLLSEDGEPFLADFGISRLTDATRRTRTDLSFTPAHVAPEIVLAGEPTKAVDIYSLASTLFELMAGRPAFVADRDDNILTVLNRIVHDPVPNLLRPKGVPEPVCRVVESAMAKDPVDRPASAADLARQLEVAVQRAYAAHVSLPDTAAHRKVETVLLHDPLRRGEDPAPPPPALAPAPAPTADRPRAPAPAPAPTADRPPAPQPVYRVAPPATPLPQAGPLPPPSPPGSRVPPAPALFPPPPPSPPGSWVPPAPPPAAPTDRLPPPPAPPPPTSAPGDLGPPPHPGAGGKPSRHAPVLVAIGVAAAAIVAVVVVLLVTHGSSAKSPPLPAPTTTPATSTPPPSATTVPGPPPSPPTTMLVTVAGSVSSVDAAGVQQSLARYFSAINDQQWQAAWQQLTPNEQALNPPAKLAQGDRSTQDSNVVINGISPRSDGSVIAMVTFTSKQAPADSPNGQPCDNWTLDYTMIPAAQGFLIDVAHSPNPVPYQTCPAGA